MPIYTRKGDKGTTKVLSTDQRIDKDNLLVEALGNVDELNSFMGLSRSESNLRFSRQQLFIVQNNLLTIGSLLAGSNLKFSSIETKKLEREIDRMTAELPQLSSFILPGGVGGSAYLHAARSICRRTERSLFKLAKTVKIDVSVLKYINRLSDYLFTLARYENNLSGMEDEKWVK